MQAEGSPSKPKLSDIAEGIANRLISGEMKPAEVDWSVLQKVYGYLRRRKLEVAEIPDYALATKIDKISKELAQRFKNDTATTKSAMVTQRLESRLENAKQSLRDAENSRQAIKEKFDSDRQRAIEKMKSRQKKNLEKFDEQFDGPVPSKYHYSADYHELEKQELYLRKSQRYEEAMKIHEELMAIREFEDRRNRMRYRNDLVEERNILLAKHEKELRVLNEHWDVKWSVIDPDARNREECCRKAIREIESRMSYDHGAQSQQPSANISSRLPSLYGHGRGPSRGRSTISSYSEVSRRKMMKMKP